MTDTSFEFIAGFTEYGNQPRVISAAYKSRGRLCVIRDHQKVRMTRGTMIAGYDRVSLRPGLPESDWYQNNPVRRKGRTYASLAPKSPTNLWRVQMGYQQVPF